ncbi:MAG: hypothetical protein R2727_05800 [Bacteroidales bacterium]
MKIKGIILLTIFMAIFQSGHGMNGANQDSTGSDVHICHLIDITGKLTSINAEIFQKRGLLLSEN